MTSAGPIGSKADDRPILIVGGGIGGLATALALARVGIRTHLLEQAPEFKEIGAGIQVGPNGFHVLEALGLTAEISKVVVFPENLIMMDCVTGEEVTRVPLGADFRDRFSYPYALVHRSDLHQVLLDACRASTLVRLETSKKAIGVEQKDGGVVVRVEGQEACEGAALVGADGLWSTIRNVVIGDGKPTVSGHIAYRAVLPVDEMPAHLRWHSMVVWAGEKTHLVHYPLRGRKLFNLVAVFHSDRYEEGWNSSGDATELHERFAGTCSDVRSLLAKIDSWRMWVLCDRAPVRQWSRGNITLLGDAAHPMLQYLAQGANMAMEDAVCLADKLVANPGDPGAAFRSYQESRYLRTGRCQVMARVYGDVFHASGVVRELRNNMLRGRTPQQAFDSMEWLYSWRYGRPQASGLPTLSAAQ